MESASSKATKIKKRKRTKQKITKKSKDDGPVIKPESFDGMTNWSILQKTIEKTKENNSENASKRRKNHSENRPFKKRRLTRKATMSKSDKSSQFKNDKNDSGWFSGTDLSPGPSNRKSEQNCKDTENDQNINPEDLKTLTNVLSMDCEMVGAGYNGKESMLARVSIVNAYGQCVYDEFVKPMEKVTDYRTAVSGVRPSDLKNGKDLFQVQREVATIIEGKKLVGHALKHDFDVLFISHPRTMIRDTSKYRPFRDICDGKTPSLKKLSSIILGCDIQSGEHSSIEDAQAAMLLYLRHKKDWERQIRSRRKRPSQ